jgi:hypothetical protein
MRKCIMQGYTLLSLSVIPLIILLAFLSIIMEAAAKGILSLTKWKNTGDNIWDL